MDAFTVATELLGDLQLSSGQLAQLRAINHKYWTEVYTLLHPPGADARGAGPGAAERADEAAPAALTARQTAELRGMLERDVWAVLTPTQRARVERERPR